MFGWGHDQFYDKENWEYSDSSSTIREDSRRNKGERILVEGLFDVRGCRNGVPDEVSLSQVSDPLNNFT